MANCCDEWWNSLNDYQKKWVHYFFHDICQKRIVDLLGKEEVIAMHDFRFNIDQPKKESNGSGKE